MRNLIFIIMLILVSCGKTDAEKYKIETTLLNGSVDTFNLEVRYNKDLRKLESSIISNELFNEDGLELAYSLSQTHPLGIFYKDTLLKIKPALIQFSKIVKDYEDPLGPKLINNTLLINRDILINKNIGEISSFKIISKENINLNNNEVNILDIKLLTFINDPLVTAQELDAIPYVTLKASINIINARPIKNAYDLNKIPYVTDEAVKRIRLVSETIN